MYVLIPKEFGGGHIEETCYDGYGNFGGKDIYELVVDWNKDFIPEVIRLKEAGQWVCGMCGIKNMRDYYETGKCNWDKRDIGIEMACYDEDNRRLPYPIKITHDKNAVYEECTYSLGDPDQGWDMSEDDEEEWDEWEWEDDDEGMEGMG